MTAVQEKQSRLDVGGRNMWQFHDRVFSFRSFRLLPSRRLLLDGDKPVRLGSRALEILIALIERPGELVSKKELIRRVWPSTHVDEGNLKFQVSALRRALRDGRNGLRYLETSPGLGYRFVAAATVKDEAAPVDPQPAALMHKHNLPGPRTRLIGRADLVTKLVDRLQSQRLLTVAGPAGIGKTSIATAVAERLIGAYKHGVWLIDLAPIADPGLVPAALVSALRLKIPTDNPVPDLITALRDMRMLLVLDNCEHVIEGAAALVAGILRGSRSVQILATSREPLRADGERVHRLSPLESPPAASVRLGAAEALRFPAVQLFVQRAAATMNEFELSDADAPCVGDICRKVDGIPLAIELAASRVESFGICDLAARLDDRLRLLTGGRRAALPRHRTISTALDWSYQLLSQEEQAVFRRLAIFDGSFTLDLASAVAADPDRSSSHIADTIEGLVMKSLVVADAGNGGARFRMLETTRAYARTKLAESGEVEALGRRDAPFGPIPKVGHASRIDRSAVGRGSSPRRQPQLTTPYPTSPHLDQEAVYP